MKLLLTVYLSIIEFAKQVWALPGAVALALHQKRRKIAPNDQEIERLDRLRNPSKYLGK